MITSGSSLASTSTDTVTVVPEAWDMQSATAVLTALEVMVAPDTPSTLQVWALRMFSFILSPMSAPMPLVSPDTSMTMSSILSLLKVTLTLTSDSMPLAVAS